MALISKIRQNSWLLIVAIGLGMGGFLLMDMIGSNKGSFGNSNSIGSIDGRDISINEFTQRETAFYGNSTADPNQRRASLWDYYIQETILQNEAEKLGIGVSSEELQELMAPGQKMSPVVFNEFGGQSGQFDAEMLQNALKNLGNFDANQREYWRGLEDRVIMDRTGQKITNLVSKAVYTPTWMVEMSHQETEQKVDFKFVGIPYASIGDEEVTVSDSDLKSYIKANAYKYKQDEETRQLDFLKFNVIPTPADSAAKRDAIANLIGQFASAEDDSTFVLNNYGQIDVTYFKADQLSPAISDTIADLPVGSVYGPYLDGNQYKAVKVLDRMLMADSVKARHILLPVDQPNLNIAGVQAAQSKADSIVNLIKTGVESFDSLAAKFGSDGTRTKGGDLGYAAPGSYVKPFNDLVFFTGQQGKLYTVTTQFGVHVVEITNKKMSDEQGVQLAYLSETIIPSKKTRNDVRAIAFQFVSDNRDIESIRAAAAENPDLNVESTSALKKNDYFIPGLQVGQSSRDMIKWAYEAEQGDVSKVLYTFQDPVEAYDNMFVIAGLSSVRKPGVASVDAVRGEVERLVINQKKAEKIKAQATSSNLEELAGQFQTQVNTATGVSFNQGFVPGLGAEPSVVAQAFNMAANQVSQPIAGESGVYLVELTYKPDATAISDIVEARNQATTPFKTQASSGLFEALKKKVKISDNRSVFF